MKKTLIIATAALLASTSAGAEQVKCTAISKLPYIINAPGIYCLKKNLAFESRGVAFTGGNAITINGNADGTVLDLNGFTLSGGNAPNTSTATGILSLASNVVIRNGTVRNFRTGIHVSDSPDNPIIENMVVDNSLSTGILLTGTSGTVRNSHVTDTGGYAGETDASASGINVNGDDFSITNNKISNVKASGLGIGVGIMTDFDADGAIIHGNHISRIDSVSGSTAGIYFSAGTEHIASDNRISKPGSTGISVGGGSTGSYMNNLVQGATSSGYLGGTPAGTTNY